MTGPPLHRVLLAVVLLMAAVLPAAAAQADRSVRLKTTFQGQQATATMTVPDAWRGDVTGDHVKLTAPSSRPGCDHLVSLKLRMLYVASTVTAADWVAARLAGNGPTIAAGGDAYTWGVAARAGRRTSVGFGALLGGSGRFGRIMVELKGGTGLEADCTTAQSPQAAKRLARVLQNAVVQSAKRRR